MSQETIPGQNKYLIQGSETAICLVDKQGKHRALAWIDTEDLDRVKKWRWYLDKGYVKAMIVGYTVRLHLLIMRRVTINDGLEADHIDHDKLNNRKENLRICTHRQNMQNMKNTVSGYPGVNWFKRDQVWRARIKDNRKKEIHLGYFKNKQDAINARKQAEIEYGFNKVKETKNDR